MFLMLQSPGPPALPRAGAGKGASAAGTLLTAGGKAARGGQGAAKEATAEAKRKCEGTLGDWFENFHLQAAVPAATAPRGNETCSLDCNKVMPGRGIGGPGWACRGAVLHVCAALWCTDMHTICCTVRSSRFNRRPPHAHPHCCCSPGRRLQRAHWAVHLPRGLARLQLPAPHEAPLHPSVQAVRFRGAPAGARPAGRGGQGKHLGVCF
jgi:hypothetical protein